MAVDNKDYNTIMAHFYRGEVGRIMVWRQRLDTTTNWAIGASTGVITLGLGHPEITHFVFLFANILVFLLLVIEGRRYMFYDAFRARVRILEAHYLAPVVTQMEFKEGDWRILLGEDLMMPSFKISIHEAIGRRLMRIYIWIFLILSMAWVLKLLLHYGPISGVWDLLKALNREQPLPPILFAGLAIGFYVVLGYYLLQGRRRTASGEFQKKAFSLGNWKI